MEPVENDIGGGTGVSRDGNGPTRKSPRKAAAKEKETKSESLKRNSMEPVENGIRERTFSRDSNGPKSPTRKSPRKAAAKEKETKSESLKRNSMEPVENDIRERTFSRDSNGPKSPTRKSPRKAAAKEKETKSESLKRNSMEPVENGIRERTFSRDGNGPKSPTRKSPRKTTENAIETKIESAKGKTENRKRKREDCIQLKTKFEKKENRSLSEEDKKTVDDSSLNNSKTNPKLKRPNKQGKKLSPIQEETHPTATENATSVNYVESIRNKLEDGSDSDESSDRDLMENALSPSQTINSKFGLNDVVWAKMNRDPYWPAQVKRIQKKTKKYYVIFLGYIEKRSYSCKRLLPFACDAGKREELMKEASQFDASYFQNAFTEAEDLVRKKALGISIEPDEDEDYELVDIEDINDTNQEKQDAPVVETPKLDEPTDVRRSKRAKKQFSKYNHDILSYIREAKPILKEILAEKRPCERHKIFTTGNAKAKSVLKHQSGFGPISDSDLEIDIVEMLQEFYNEVTTDKDNLSRVTYVVDVWLPE
ncbi:hypothetical protein QZH41_016648, partial [Actinostola sp. cb2023]